MFERDFKITLENKQHINFTIKEDLKMKISQLNMKNTRLGFTWIILFLLILTNFSCKENIKEESVEFLEIDYLPPLATFSFVYDCEGLFKSLHDENYILVDDQKYLNQFKIYFSKLTPKNNDTLRRDFRVKLIYHQKDHSDTICMGIFNGIVVNGQLMNEDENFTRFVSDFVNKNYVPRHLKESK